MDIESVYETYVDMVYRVAFIYLKNRSETEDVTQNVFIKLMNREINFESQEHLKAWLIKTTKNTCKDVLKSWWRKKRNTFESLEIPSNKIDLSIWENVENLNDKYKLPIYLYYYEGYKTDEISKILDINHATIRTRLRDARKKLKILVEEDEV